MAKKKNKKQRFDIAYMEQNGGYTTISNLLFDYQEELGLDFTDLGILCKICRYSKDFSINFSKHFTALKKTQRTARINRLREMGYITTRKNNFKTSEGTITGGLFVSIEPLITILDELQSSVDRTTDFPKSEGSENRTLPPVESSVDRTSNNTISNNTNREIVENRLHDFPTISKEPLPEVSEEEWIEKVNAIEIRADITEEEIQTINDCREFIKNKMETCESMNGEFYRLFSLNQSFGAFWEKTERNYTEADKEAKENYDFACHYNRKLNPAVDNLWLFYSNDAETFVEPETFERLFSKSS